MEPKQTKFRFSARIGIWTYSTGELDPNLTTTIIRDAILALGYPLEYFTIGREICPTTGNVHFHVYIEFVTRPNIKRRE